MIESTDVTAIVEAIMEVRDAIGLLSFALVISIFSIAVAIYFR